MCQGLGPKKHDEISEIDRSMRIDRTVIDSNHSDTLDPDIVRVSCLLERRFKNVKKPGRNKKPNRTDRTEPNHIEFWNWPELDAEPNRTELDRAATRPKNAGLVDIQVTNQGLWSAFQGGRL